MSQEIFTFIQSHSQTSTNLFNLVQESGKENFQEKSFIFDNLINELKSEIENPDDGQILLTQTEKNNNPPVMNFKSQKSFSWPIINNFDTDTETKAEKILHELSSEEEEVIVFYDDETEAPEIKDIKQPVDVKNEQPENNLDEPLEFPELKELPEKIQNLVKNFVAEVEAEVEIFTPEVKQNIIDLISIFKRNDVVDVDVKVNNEADKDVNVENFAELPELNETLEKLPEKIQSIVKNFVAEVETEVENFTTETKQNIVNLISIFKRDNNNSKPVDINVDVDVNQTDTAKNPVELHEPSELFSSPKKTKKDSSIRVALKNFVVELKNEFQSDNPEINQPVVDLISALTNLTENNHELKTEAPENNNNFVISNKTPVIIAQPEEDFPVNNNDKEISVPDVEYNVNSANLAGVSVNVPDVIFEVEPKTAENENETPTKIQTSTAPFEQEKISPEINKNTVKQNVVQPKLKSEAKSSRDFSSIIEADNDETEPHEFTTDNSVTNNNADENSQENNSQNFNQPRENSSAPQNFSRSRNNDDRKISSTVSNSQDENSFANSNSSTRRIDSHNTFQNFFEGVLNNRRTVSRRSTLPLNIRTDAYNFNRSETVRNGLVNVVRFIRADGVQKASVVIDPPALGRISVELTSNSSGVEASIKVASEQIRQIVQDQLVQLRENLSQQGVQVSEFTVDVQQDSRHGGGNYQENNQRRQNFVLNGIDDEDTEEFRIDIEEGLLYWVA